MEPPDLDPVLHPINRMLICSALTSARLVEFSTLQQLVGLSASALSKQVKVLTEHGYVRPQRATDDTRRVWLSITPEGREAYRRHLATLQEIIDAAAADEASLSSEQ